MNEAEEKLGKEHVDYDKHLREIVRDKQYWESKRVKIQRVEKSLDNLSEEYVAELQQTQKQRKEIIQEAKREAQRIIDEANKVVEKTIREIRESQAEKDKTKEIRKKLIEHKQEVEKVDHEKDIKIDQKIDKIKQKEQDRANRKKQEPALPKVEEKKKIAVFAQRIQNDNLMNFHLLIIV